MNRRERLEAWVAFAAASLSNSSHTSTAARVADAMLAEAHKRFGSQGEPPEEQIRRLGAFIMENVEDEPSEDEGAVDCAIRIMRDAAEL